MSAIVEAELISSPMLIPRESDLPALTIRQQNFVRHYLDPNNFRNGTEAAKKAGFQGDDNTLGVCAYDLLRNPKIQSHIQHALKQRHISPDEVIAELSDIALAPWKDFVQLKYGPNNEVLSASIRLTDKLKAIELAGKYHQQWDRNLEQSDSQSTSELISVLRELLDRAKAAQAVRVQLDHQALNPADTTP